jgi:hypothetical protein
VLAKLVIVAHAFASIYFSPGKKLLKYFRPKLLECVVQVFSFMVQVDCCLELLFSNVTLFRTIVLAVMVWSTPGRLSLSLVWSLVWLV